MDEESITQVLEQYAAAVFGKDVDALLALYDDDVRVFDLWDVWSHQGADPWRESVAGWFASVGDERVRVDFDDVQTLVTEDLATVHAIITYRDIGPDDVEQDSMQNRLTWVLGRRDGDWKIVHEHTSAPVNGETFKVNLQRY
ncbi:MULTISPECIES: YybH family protein [unclassified Arthrobacter]|uniref:YybH family protein n=1 Tax=unclassified Arthrobacter TaxID=235627 RepID=UPI0002E4013A|nr:MULTISPECIES: SgcJ/EcaC family oxidoreductase [unclassified Arthrobacter]